MNRPARLGARAQKLWDGVLNEAELDSAGLSVLEEACRTLDIIDRLSGALNSKNQEWMRLGEEAELLAGGAVEIHIVINPLLGELRQQRMALKTLFSQLKIANSKPKTKESKEKSLFELLEAEFNN